MVDINIDRKESMDFIPKKVAQKCPVCNGFGTLKNGTLTCHGCDGKGWVVVDQDIEIEIKTGENYGQPRVD